MRLYLSKSQLILISSVLGAFLIILFIIIKGWLGIQSPPPKIELEFWSVFDDNDVYRDLISSFQSLHPNVRIKYRWFPYEEYERVLVDTLAAGKGPDIFSIHNTWLPKHYSKIVPLAQDSGQKQRPLMTLRQFQETFSDVASQDFVLHGQIYAIPYSIDSLALFYNKDLLNAAGIPQPPTTWDEFVEDVIKLTRFNQKGQIELSGASLGTASNINRSTDILALLMIQNGAKMTDPQRKKATFDDQIWSGSEVRYPGQEALEFYVSFADPRKKAYTWNQRMHYSVDAFYEGKVAMMLNYSYIIPTLKKKTPYLNFGIAPVPQVKDAPQKITYANYWGQTVSRKTLDSQGQCGYRCQKAWEFVLFVAQRENAKKYLELSRRPTARRDLVLWQRDDVELGVFAESSLWAQTWWQPDNLAVEAIFAEMIEQVNLKNKTPRQAIQRAAEQVELLFK